MKYIYKVHQTSSRGYGEGTNELERLLEDGWEIINSMAGGTGSSHGSGSLECEYVLRKENQ